MSHIIAIDTYGREQVRHPRTQVKVSAFKMSYTTAASEVLLDLFDSKARNVSPTRASYHYIQVDVPLKAHGGYLILRINDAELKHCEAITRQHTRTGVYLWKDRAWHEFPSSRQDTYQPALSSTGPRFKAHAVYPTPVSASNEEATNSGSPEDITIERSQRSASDQPWYWIQGTTYPHRETLRRWGARWSKGRRAWYFIGDPLPDALRQLAPVQEPVASVPLQPVQIEPDEPLLSIFGGAIRGKETSRDGELILQGENRVLATRTTWIDSNDQMQPAWVFDLPNPPTPEHHPIQPVQDALRHAGARYSYSTYRWYFDDPEQVARLDTLAAAVLAATIPAETVAAPSNISAEAAPPYTPQAWYKVGQTIYAPHDLTTANGTIIPTGTSGQITQVYAYRHELVSEGGHSYEVDFGEFGTGWFFQSELTDLKPVPGIRITHGAVVPPGAAQPPSDAELKTALIESGHGPLPSSPEPKPSFAEGQRVSYHGNYPQETNIPGKPVLPDMRGRILSVIGDTRILVDFDEVGTAMMHQDDLSPLQSEPPSKSEPESPSPAQPALPEPDAPPPVRVIPPLPISSTIRAAVQAAPAVPPSTVPATGKLPLMSIPMAYVGELTGSITGSVWCYGYAVHNGICIYLNLGGPRVAVEAIRARLGKGEIVNLVPWDAPAIELTAGEGNTGMYTAFLNSIPEAKFASAILLHELAVQPNYGGKSITFLFHLDDAQIIAHLKHHVSQLVTVPVFDCWATYLWAAGQAAMLVRKTQSGGGITLFAVDLDSESWSRLIAGGLAESLITLPDDSS